MDDVTQDDNEIEWVGVWQDREDVREETRHIDYWDSVKPRPLSSDFYEDDEDDEDDEEQFED